MRILREKGVPVSRTPEMRKILTFGKASMEFLHPLAPCREGTPEEENRNDNSVVFKLTFGRDTVLFPGDITAAAERTLSELSGSGLRAATLVAPHHGSSTSSSLFFLDQVRPERVIVSCGWRNSFGFPHGKVLERYVQRGISIHRTDTCGAVQVELAGDGSPEVTCMGE
jgi:competence protein ComEC